MNRNIPNIIIACAVLLAGALQFSSAATGAGEKCTDRRSLNAAEQKAFSEILLTIRNAMPPAPGGWTKQKTTPPGTMARTINEMPGCPLGATYQVSYINEKSIMEHIKQFEKKKSAQAVEKLAAEMSAAAEKGDSKKLQKLQDELESLNSAPAGKITARITVRINLAHNAENLRGSRPCIVQGVKYSFLLEDKGGKKLVIYIGKWKKKEGHGVLPNIEKNVSNAAVQILEILVEGDIAEELAAGLNMKSLNALIK